MLSKILPLLFGILLLIGAFSSLLMGETPGTFGTFNAFKKDFFVAFGDPNSWRINKNILECTGTPNGYICTKKSYSNYILTVEFRFPKQAGNTGILNYISGRHQIWPKCVEVQGHYTDLAKIFPMGGLIGPRNDGNDSIRVAARKPHTEWNKLEITSNKGVLSAKLNNIFIGKSGPYKVRKGPIGFQSEGAPVHFRKILIEEL